MAENTKPKEGPALREVVMLRDAEAVQKAIRRKYGFEVSLQYASDFIEFWEAIRGQGR
jgi:hypothetical protein